MTLVRTDRKRIRRYARPDKMVSMSHGPRMISLELPDGRVLEVVVSGPPDGVPLV